MEVPKKFLEYFRYRDGFLILAVRHALPIGLVRFLLSLWIRCPLSLWLVEPVRFKYYLKRHRSTDFISEPVFSESTLSRDEEFTQAQATAAQSLIRLSDEEIEDEFDQFMKRKFGLNPALF